MTGQRRGRRGGRVLGEASLSKREKNKIKVQLKENKGFCEVTVLPILPPNLSSPSNSTPSLPGWVLIIGGPGSGHSSRNVPQEGSPLRRPPFSRSGVAPPTAHCLGTPGCLHACRATCALCSLALGPLFRLPLSAILSVSAPFLILKKCTLKHHTHTDNCTHSQRRCIFAPM